MGKFDPTWKEHKELPGELEEPQMVQRLIAITWSETIEYTAEIILFVPSDLTNEEIRKTIIESDDTTAWYQEIVRQGRTIKHSEVEAVQLLSVDPINDNN